MPVRRAGASWVQVGAGWCRLVGTHGCTARVGMGAEGFRAGEGVYDLQTETLLPLSAASWASPTAGCASGVLQLRASAIPCKLVHTFSMRLIYTSCMSLVLIQSMRVIHEGV